MYVYAYVTMYATIYVYIYEDEHYICVVRRISYDNYPKDACKQQWVYT